MIPALTGAHWTTHRLTAGSLHLKSTAGQPTDLFCLAERLNPRRAFLFVSTVLGRHIPVAPKDHRAVLQRLATKLLDQLPADGPVFVMGYAETAVGLGAGVFQELHRAHPRRAIGYQATTRFAPHARDVWFRMEEPHSHASDHLILTPKDGVLQDGPGASLVLVDDETTTGTTFRNLAAKMHAAGLRFNRVVLATLTDWSEGSAAASVSEAIPGAEVAAVSLFNGAWLWEPDNSQDKPQLPGMIAAECPAWHPTGRAVLEVARFGIAGTDAEEMIPGRALRIASEAGLDVLPHNARVLVLGAGEHVWEPFLFAETVSERYPNTRFAATTRSPILPGDAIRHKIVFGDHYGLGLEMYLHNVAPEEWDAIVLFNETGMEGVPGVLMDTLGAVAVVDQDARVAHLRRQL
ncbi:MAG: phosphoribosyltransferase domain-containing protein [Rhodobacteraceae bacterium]|nr:phosphoribosyltransferase domain-containing protein [Paracoccaceae bacterium]